MTTYQLLRRSVEEARAAVARSLPADCKPLRESLVGMCAVVACETARRLELAGRKPQITYRLGVAAPLCGKHRCPFFVHHFWVECDGYVLDGTAKQLGGPLALVSRRRDQGFFDYSKAERSWRTSGAVARFLSKLGWRGPAAALLAEAA